MTEVPEWVVTLVGRYALENEALRRALADAQAQPAETEPAETGR